MKNYFSKIPFCRTAMLLCIALFFFTACKKESPGLTNLDKQETVQTTKFVPEKINTALLNDYVNYQINSQASLLLKRAGKNVESATSKISRKEIDLMIENYLANERNMILSKAFIKNQSTPGTTFRAPWDDTPELPVGDDGLGSPGNPFTGTGTFPGSSITNIVFTGNLSNKGVISQQAFSFGGVHGTITPTGSISQAVYNGVTTYQQNFSETYTFPGGIVYVQNFVVYGNIYGGSVTVTAMALPQPR
jgi:hypothetical protein